MTVPADPHPQELVRLESPVHVEVGAEVGRELVVAVRIRNDGERRIYVADRPVREAGSSGYVDDADTPYRFVRDGHLRVLLGDCPLPRHLQVNRHHHPQLTAVEPGAVHGRTFRMPGPVLEHSAYWPLAAFRGRPPEIQARLVERTTVSIVSVLVDVLVDQPGLVPRDGVSGATTFARAALAFLATFRVHAAVSVVENAASRRLEIDARPLLPGEEPERFASRDDEKGQPS